MPSGVGISFEFVRTPEHDVSSVSLCFIGTTRIIRAEARASSVRLEFDEFLFRLNNRQYNRRMMETIVHLWNVSTFFEKINNPEVVKLRMHYSRCCREMSDRTELPKQKFGAAALCPQCGSSWASTKHKTRIASAKRFSRRMDSLIRGSSNGLRLSKYRRTLIRKYKMNGANKIIKICLVCSGTAKLALSKPQRQMIAKSSNLSKDLNITMFSKKKKKRTKDRMAGLNVSSAKTLDANLRTITPLRANQKNNVLTLEIPKSLSKPKKIDLSKLKGILNTTVTLSKKNKLHTFLQVLR